MTFLDTSICMHVSGCNCLNTSVREQVSGYFYHSTQRRGLRIPRMDVYTFVLVCVGLIGMIILLYKCMDSRAKERAVAASHKTDVDTVGKDSEGHVEHVSATGLRSDNMGDALKAMAQTKHIKTTGMKKGSANTVEVTGLDFRRRQQRPGEDKTKPMPRATTKTSVEVTGMTDGKAGTVIAVGVRK
ncbi:uncharacterized protein [Haliotis cracherodii]|uniref:uncharacterized protein isoform X2 n=1 Tax=Haliotis cracherodii TaxID=6455 RepID=UPI0039EAF3A5